MNIVAKTLALCILSATAMAQEQFPIVKVDNNFLSQPTTLTSLLEITFDVNLNKEILVELPHTKTPNSAVWQTETHDWNLISSTDWHYGQDKTVEILKIIPKEAGNYEFKFSLLPYKSEQPVQEFVLKIKSLF